jgi:hypothetical protein
MAVLYAGSLKPANKQAFVRNVNLLITEIKLNYIWSSKSYRAVNKIRSVRMNVTLKRVPVTIVVVGKQ